MRFWVGLTDRDWFDFLSHQRDVEEVNFWQPSARKPVDFVPGEPFLFKLKARYGGWVVGGGFWAHFTVLPARLAWDYFGQMNGAADLPEMERRVRRYRRDFDVHADHIGCIALARAVLPAAGRLGRSARRLASQHPGRSHVRHLGSDRSRPLATRRARTCPVGRTFLSPGTHSPTANGTDPARWSLPDSGRVPSEPV